MSQSAPRNMGVGLSGLCGGRMGSAPVAAERTYGAPPVWSSGGPFFSFPARVVPGAAWVVSFRTACRAWRGPIMTAHVPRLEGGGGGCDGQPCLSGGGEGYSFQFFLFHLLRFFFLVRLLTGSLVPFICLGRCFFLSYSFPLPCVVPARPFGFMGVPSLTRVLFSLKEFASFFSKTLAKRVPAGGRSTVEHHEYLCHVHSRSNGLVAVALCDREYPSRVAFTLLSKVTDDFLAAFPVESSWHSVRDDGSGSSHTPALSFPVLDTVIEKYQDPAQADPIMKIQKDLDDTKVILHKTIDGVLERGVKLDSLVEKSNDLSLQSKMFYKQAKSQNSCCGMM